MHNSRLFCILLYLLIIGCREAGQTGPMPETLADLPASAETDNENGKRIKQADLTFPVWHMELY
jgi:hypothetical protein